MLSKKILTMQDLSCVGQCSLTVVDHAQKSRQKIKENHRPNWEASHYYANEDGESYRSREYT